MSFLSAVKSEIGTESNPAISINQINQEISNPSTGTYYLSPNGFSGTEEVFCTVESDGNLYGNFELDPQLTNDTGVLLAIKSSDFGDFYVPGALPFLVNTYSHISSSGDLHVVLNNASSNNNLQTDIEYANPQTGSTYPTSFIKALRDDFIHSETSVAATADDDDDYDPNGEVYLGRGDPDSGEYLVTPSTGDEDPRRNRYRLRNGQFEPFSIDSKRSHPTEPNGGQYYMPTSLAIGVFRSGSGSNSESWGYNGSVIKVR
jgi:hypothetical protein